MGIGYIDDCLILAVNYITDYAYSGSLSTNHTFMLQLSLRTLGGNSSSPGVSALNSGGSRTAYAVHTHDRFRAEPHDQERGTDDRGHGLEESRLTEQL